MNTSSCSGCNQQLEVLSGSSNRLSFSENLCSSCTLKKLLVLLRRGNVVCDCCGRFYRPNKKREMSRFFCSTCESSFNKMSREELKNEINRVCPYKKIKKNTSTTSTTPCSTQQTKENPSLTLEESQIVSESSQKDDDGCCLCLSPYKVGEYKRELSCGHIFHKKCVDQWFLSKGNCELEDCTCPLCRASLATHHEEENVEENVEVETDEPLIQYSQRKHEHHENIPPFVCSQHSNGLDRSEIISSNQKKISDQPMVRGSTTELRKRRRVGDISESETITTYPQPSSFDSPNQQTNSNLQSQPNNKNTRETSNERDLVDTPPNYSSCQSLHNFVPSLPFSNSPTSYSYQANNNYIQPIPPPPPPPPLSSYNLQYPPADHISLYRYSSVYQQPSPSTYYPYCFHSYHQRPSIPIPLLSLTPQNMSYVSQAHSDVSNWKRHGVNSEQHPLPPFPLDHPDIENLPSPLGTSNFPPENKHPNRYL